MELMRLGIIAVGNYKSVEELRAALKDADIEVEICSRQMFNEMVLVPEETTIDIVVLSLEDLGFKEPMLLEEIISRAEEMGFERCPGETAAQALIQMELFPVLQEVSFAMNPLRDRDGDLSVFRIDPNDPKLIDSAWGVDCSELEDRYYTFIRPKNLKTTEE